MKLSIDFGGPAGPGHANRVTVSAGNYKESTDSADSTVTVELPPGEVFEIRAHTIVVDQTPPWKKRKPIFAENAAKPNTAVLPAPPDPFARPPKGPADGVSRVSGAVLERQPKRYASPEQARQAKAAEAERARLGRWLAGQRDEIETDPPVDLGVLQIPPATEPVATPKLDEGRFAKLPDEELAELCREHHLEPGDRESMIAELQKIQVTPQQ